MSTLTQEKLAQAVELVQASDADVWLTFVRETAATTDPVLPLIHEGGFTWHCALLVARDGRKVAIVGNYDADPLEQSGDWHQVLTYVQGIRETLLSALEELIHSEVERPRIAVNFSESDPLADGLTHGMLRTLSGYLAGSRFQDSLCSAEGIVMSLRGRKSPTELARIRAAVAETGRLFECVQREVRIGHSELEVYQLLQAEIDRCGMGYAWDRSLCPIVNTGPDSAEGHSQPSADLRIAPGHLFHIDLGVTLDGYSSDLQRCWYVPQPGETAPPEVLLRALAAVNGAISAAAAALRPGVPGWEVDRAAREYIIAAGYPEYLHAVGHQVGRIAHDGGGVLAPRWERYGRTPELPVEADQVYTLELGVEVKGCGYLSLEEMVRVTESGVEWLSQRQLELPLLG